MLSPEQNTLLTQTSAGTPMGELLRRYWWPIAGVSEFDEQPTKPVRLMGEDLTLYKDKLQPGTYLSEFDFHPIIRDDRIQDVLDGMKHAHLFRSGLDNADAGELRHFGRTPGGFGHKGTDRKVERGPAQRAG